jgi:hypothetical protein
MLRDFHLLAAAQLSPIDNQITGNTFYLTIVHGNIGLQYSRIYYAFSFGFWAELRGHKQDVGNFIQIIQLRCDDKDDNDDNDMCCAALTS